MSKKINDIVREIRLDRGLSLSEFSIMLGVSLSYLCLVEKGDRKLTKEMVLKIIKALPDITIQEKQLLEKVVLFNPKEMQKYIMKLIAEFFYRLKNGLDGLDKLGEEIISFIKELKEKDRTDEMAMFSKI